MQNGDENQISAEMEEEALYMLVRACDNYSRLCLPLTNNMRQFDAWFGENVIGL